MRQLLLMTILIPTVAAAMPQKQPKPRQTPETAVTPAGEVRILDDDEAKALVKELNRSVLSASAIKGKNASFSKRLSAVEALAKVQHKRLVPVLKRVITRDPSKLVRGAAANAVLAQPKKEAMSLARAMLKKSDVCKDGLVSGPMVHVLRHYGARPREWAALRKRFHNLGFQAQAAVLQAIAENKDWDALDFLLENLDPPAPANVDDPANPPAEYWKARWEAWSKFRLPLRAALRALLGQDFASSVEARKWIESQGGVDKLRRKSGR